MGRHFIEASAGTGKTFAIEHIFARLLLEKDFSVQEVLLVTFTRAAARELKERIHANLASIPKEKKVEEALIEMDRAAIFTIHGFCHRMLSEFAFEAGMTPALPDPDSSDWTSSVRRAVLKVLRSPLSGFDPVQLDLLLRHFGNSVERLVDQLVATREGEALPDFSEMEKKYVETLPEISSEELLAALEEASGNYKGLASRSGELHPHFAKQAELFGSSKHFSALLGEELFLGKLTEENRKKRARGVLSPLLMQLQDGILPIIEEARSPQNTFLRLAHLVEAEMADEEAVSPDDLLLQMRKALDKPAFCEAIQQRYRAAIIDEFQDTDPLQWEIFAKLFMGAESFIVVGDPKQSIYSFRGADLRVYFRAKEEMGEEAFATLDTNYRSAGDLIEQLNALFTSGGDWLAEEGLPLTYQPVKAGGEPGGNFTFLRAEREEDLFPFIAKQALARPFSDVAILVKDRYQAARIETYLTGCQIPFRSKGMVHIAEVPLFTFFTDLFEALSDLTRLGSVKRFLAHPILGYNDQQLANADLTFELSHLHYLRGVLEESRGKFLDQLIKSPWLEGGRTIYESLKLEEYGHLMQIAELLLEAKTADPARLLQEIKRKRIESDMRYKAQRLADENSVTVMTMHMSKGLEFPVVFALNLAAKEREEKPEAMRGLYVALTRAKEKVYFPLIEGKPTLGQRFYSQLQGEFETIQVADEPVPKFEEAAQALTHIPFDRTFLSTYLHSFTSLATKKLYDGESLRPGLNELPAGADVGIYLHALLEKTVDEALYLKEDFAQQILAMARAGIFADHAEEIAAMVLGAFAISLEEGFALEQLSPSKMVTEMEFLYPRDQSTNLKGFADLIFERENRLYLVDWKSNYLGDQKEHYEKAQLEKAMSAHEYFLQATIYGEALARYANATGKELGGIYYFFLRGLKWDLGVYRCNTSI